MNFLTILSSFSAVALAQYFNSSSELIPPTVADVITITHNTVVTEFTTYCPEPTTIVTNDKTFTITEPTILTITDCPCTIPTTYISTPSTEEVTSTDITTDHPSSEETIATTGITTDHPSSEEPTISTSEPTESPTVVTFDTANIAAGLVNYGSGSIVGLIGFIACLL